MNKFVTLLLLVVLVFSLALTACSGVDAQPADAVPGSTSGVVPDAADTVTGEEEAVYVPVSVSYDSDDLDASWDSAGATRIVLSGNAITLEGKGATIDGSKVTITSGGTYVVSGTLADGQIRVDVGDEETVRLVLNGVDITCSASAPIYVLNVGKTVITLAEGTQNIVTDGEEYVLEDADSDEPSAAIFSNDDLTINGGGSLTVRASYRNGIQSQDDLKITSGRITIEAVNDGIKGRDCVAIRDGHIVISAGGDGIQSNNDGDSAKGFVAIENGQLDITAALDGIQAATNVYIGDGNLTVSTGGGSANGLQKVAEDWGTRNLFDRPEVNQNSETVTLSTKGIKAAVNVTIQSGMVVIDSADDCIHSNDSLVISGGTIQLASGDDGIHADATLEIGGGEISIAKSYEGIESSVITISGGSIHLVASDDGINAVGGVDSSAINGRPGQNNFSPTGNDRLDLSGGYIVIDAGGDGLDINGRIDMTGGTVIINGPTSNDNGALDYLGTFTVTGGYLVGAGSSGMAEAPSTSSTQYSVLVNFETAQEAGTIVCIETQEGEEVLTFTPTKVYQSMVLCSPDLKEGETYVVRLGGSYTGQVTDSLCSGGEYNGGTESANFTVTSVVTMVGSPSSSPGGHHPKW